MIGKDLIVAVTVTFCITLTLFSVVPTSSQLDVGEYNPWVDLNNDGTIDIFDLVPVALSFGSSGTPFQGTAALEYDSGWINITDKCGQYFDIIHNLNSTDIMVDITGKTTLGGGVHQRNLGGTGYTPGWSKTYGGTGTEYAYSAVQTADGGYAITGATQSYSSSFDLWLVKIDANGNAQWNRTFGGTAVDEAQSVVQTEDGGYAMAGVTYSYGDHDGDFWLVKTDANGNAEWNRTYGGIGTGIDYGYCMIATGDGGYAIAGATDRFSGSGDFWLVKTDFKGNAQWNKTYGGVYDAKPDSVVQTSDGGYAIAGRTDTLLADFDFWLVKTDANGNAEWNRTYGGIGHDEAHSVFQTDDGGYVIVGQTYSYGAGLADFWLVKTDAEGKMQWSRTYGGTGTEVPYSVVQAIDGGYAVAGHTNSYSPDYELWLVKTDTYGNVQWRKRYGGADGDYAWHILQVSDGGYVIVGQTDSYGAINSDAWLVKTEVESGLTWTDSTANMITLHRGATDSGWNFVRVRIWKPKTP